MGFNSVAFLLNDMMNEIQRSPKAITYGLAHPPMSDRKEHIDRWHDMVRSVAREEGEPVPNRQCIEMLGTWHADGTKVVAFGGNYYTVLHETYGFSHHTEENKLRIVREMANDLGYTLRKKPEKK